MEEEWVYADVASPQPRPSVVMNADWLLGTGENANSEATKAQSNLELSLSRIE